MDIITIPTVVSTVINLITIGIVWGRMTERLKTIEVKLRKDETDAGKASIGINDLHTEQQRLAVALWGIDGSNGLRGNVKEVGVKVELVKAEIQHVRDELRDSTSRQRRIEEQLNDIAKKLDR